MLRLAGCGDGGALQPGKRGVAMTVSGSLVTGPEPEVLYFLTVSYPAVTILLYTMVIPFTVPA